MTLKFAGALAALIALSACGNQSDGDGLKDRLMGMVPGREKAAAPAAPSPEELRAMAAKGPTLLVRLPALGLEAPATPAGVNSEKVTWVAGGMTATMQGGFLLATRGIGDDLLGVEVEGFGPALKNGGQYSRIMEWLDGRDSVQRVTLTCRISVQPGRTVTVLAQSYPVTLYSDNCTGQGLQFTNQYWIGSDKKLRQTRQYVAKSVGYLQSQQL